MRRGIHGDNMISPHPHTLSHTLGCQHPAIPFPNSQSFQSANLYESWVCPPECKLGTPVGQGAAQRWGGTTGGSVHGTWDRWSRVFYTSWRGHSHHKRKPGCGEKEVDLGPRQWEASSPWPHGPDVTARSQRILNLSPTSILLIKLCLPWRVEHMSLFKHFQAWIITSKYLSAWHMGLHLHTYTGPYKC